MRSFWLACAALLCCLSSSGCGNSGQTGDQPVANVQPVSNEAKDGATETSAAAIAPPVEKTKPTVIMETSAGRIVIRLNSEASPLTVENFLRYVDEGHYDGTIFHQVDKNYVVVGGGLTPDMKEKPTHTPVRNEAADNGLSNRRGTIAMTRGEAIDSSTSQFFFNLNDNHEQLDHTGRTPQEYGYCVFGEVIEGLDVLDKIEQSPVHNVGSYTSVPVTPVVVKSVKRVK